jgi:phage terminase large subunit GpA-like protein
MNFIIDIAQFNNSAGLLRAEREAKEYIRPPREMKPTTFSEQNIVIPVGNAVPGPIRFEAAAYQRGMIDVITEPGINRVTYMLGAQLGKTTLMQCISAYFTAHDPRSQIWLMPSEGDMLTFRATKLEPMFEANPNIAEKMAKPRDRNGKNNSRMISFIGGFMMFSWSGSAKTLRGRSAPVTIADEIDGMENAGSEEKNEGDPVQLLMQRAASFSSSGQNIHIESSTPTVKGFSRVESAHDAGDCRKFFIPCQHCGHEQVMKWDNVVWNGRQDSVDADTAFKDHDVDSAGYICDSCGVIWSDGDRVASVRSGKWIATRPTKTHASFHLSELYSPFRKLRDIVQSYLDKITVNSYNTFVNVSLAETHEETGEKIDPAGLVSRAEVFEADAPMGVLYITAGVDMQPDRLECEFVGWGIGEESWSLGYHVLHGDPVAGDVWEELTDLLETEFTHESGMLMRASAVCVDTGGTGGSTQAAYEYLRGKTGRNLFGIKGVGGWGRAIVEKSQRKESGKNARRVDLFLVGVDEAKLIVMRRFAVKEPGPGYCHIPDGRHDIEKWAEQATAEKMRVRYTEGQPRRVWWKPDKARNEALDCRVYATAALKIKNPSFRRLAERMDAYLAHHGITRKPKPAPTPSETVAKPAMRLSKPTPEIQKEEAPAVVPQTARVVPPKRTLKPRTKGKNFAKSW